MLLDMITVKMNVVRARMTESLREFLRVSKVRWLPPSNSIKVRATALKSGPTYPKSLGDKMPDRGPTRIPMHMSGKTSGTRVFSKSAVKKWAAKMINPTEKTKVEIVSINNDKFSFYEKFQWNHIGKHSNASLLIYVENNAMIKDGI